MVMELDPEDEPDMPEPKGWFGTHRRTLLIGGPAAAALVAFAFYLTGGRDVSTDDAYVQAGRAEISTDVPGSVSEIDVHDNQIVRTGQILFKLDANSYRIAVDDAEAH